jgi:SAM-dependent methyltransferase
VAGKPASDQERRTARAKSFGAAASIYERARPSYPDAAVDWLLPAGHPQVVDLGAGTGKLTRMIADRGVDVTAVEPSDGMREQLQTALPGVPALAGSAEAMPLADHSVDAVLVAQAWHWVDLQRASAEVARVLRPDGRLGLLWNHRDERVDWVSELTLAITRDGSDHTGHNGIDPSNPEFGTEFGQIEYLATEWRVPMTPTGLLELVASRSNILVASEDERAEITARVQGLLNHHPQLVGRGHFEMPYVAYASRAHLN